MYEPEILIGGGFPAAEGWYATIASRIAPRVIGTPGNVFYCVGNHKYGVVGDVMQ